MAATNVNYYPDGYVVIPRKEYNELIRELERKCTCEKTKENPPAPEKRSGIDHAKIISLKNAGWSATKIAREMGISTATVYNHINQEKS